MTKNIHRPLDEMVDDASMLIATSKAGSIMSAKIATDMLPSTRRFKVADKIGKLIKNLNK